MQTQTSDVIWTLVTDSAWLVIAALAAAAAVGFVRQQMRAGADRRREAALDAYVLRELVRGSTGMVRLGNRRRLASAVSSPDLNERT